MTLRTVLSEFIAYEAELQAMLDACRNKKKPEAPECDRSNIPDGFWMDSRCELHRITAGGGFTWLLPSQQMENQAGVEGSTYGLNQLKNTKPKPPKLKKMADMYLARLLHNIAMEAWKCQMESLRANESYYRCLATKEGTIEKCRPLFKSLQCPGKKQAMQALDEYSKVNKIKTGDQKLGGF